MLWQKNTSFLEVLEFLSQNRQITCEIGVISFPLVMVNLWVRQPPNGKTKKKKEEKVIGMGKCTRFVQIAQQLTPI